jgi:hypothetical protein
MEDFNFKSFLLNENKVYLAQEIGDVLNSVQDLNDEVEKIGTRNLVRFSQIIVNKCRGILQGHWGDENKKWLLKLQKCAVALAKAIDENDNTEETLKSIQSEVEGMLNKMGVPFNKISQSSSPEPADAGQGVSPVPPSVSRESPPTLPDASIAPETPEASGFAAPSNAAVPQQPNNLGL